MKENILTSNYNKGWPGLVARAIHPDRRDLGSQWKCFIIINTIGSCILFSNQSCLQKLNKSIQINFNSVHPFVPNWLLTKKHPETFKSFSPWKSLKPTPLNFYLSKKLWWRASISISIPFFQYRLDSASFTISGIEIEVNWEVKLEGKCFRY
jgi:hypothetical protein